MGIGISQHLLVPHSDVASFIDHLDILRNVGAPTQEVAVGDVLQVDKPVVLVALVPESELTLTGTVLFSGRDEVGHDADDIERQLPLGLLGHLHLL